MKRILYLNSSSSIVGLAEACFLLTPKVSLFSNELFLEISETEKFFGGEECFLKKFRELLTSFQTKGDLVLTDRPEWAKAFHLEPEIILRSGKSREALLKLPIDRIADCGDPTTLEEERRERTHVVAFMKRVGIKTIGDFEKLPFAAINRRFGKLGVLLKEWISGERELCLPLFTYDESIRERLETDEITSLESLLFTLRNILVRIEHRLNGRALLAKELKMTFHLESRKKMVRSFKLAEPQMAATKLLILVREFLSQTTWDSPLHALEIEVSDSVPYTPSQLFLFENGEAKLQDLSLFVGRMQARYGAEGVGVPTLQTRYLPETSWKQSWPPPSDKTVASAQFPERPLLLYTQPKPFSWQKQWRLSPTEVLEAEWWSGVGKRSYFIAENPQGERAWVFRDDKTQQWFIQGVFD